MVKLTEDMIVARTRVSDMANVKKLNCWGAELTDISVMRKLVNVEVLSLSVNCITSLADFQNCKNLQELYIRKNKINELSEICWLRDLPKLKSLWLEENPCVEDQGELYRLTVIRNLPQVQKLDNVAVQPDEMADAMRRGIELVHPLEQEPGPYPNPMGFQQQPATDVARRSPSQENLHYRREHHGQAQEQRQNGGSSTCSRRQSTTQEQHYPPSRRVSNQAFEAPSDVGCSRRSSPPRNQPPYGAAVQRSQSSQAFAVTSYESEGYGGPEYHIGRRYSQQDLSNMGRSNVPSDMHRLSIRENSPCYGGNGYPTSMDRPHRASYQNFGPTSDVMGQYYDGGGERQHHFSPQQQPHHKSDPQSGCSDPQEDHSSNNDPQLTSSQEKPNKSTEEDKDVARGVLAQHYEQTYDQVSQQMESAQQRMAASRKSFSPERSYPRRPKNRNSNILSAVLCLIKELDGPSLEVAEMAIRCRMEELED